MDEKQDRPKTAVEELDFLNDVIPYRCPKCGDNRKFTKLGDLKLHLETDHSYKVGYVKPRARVKVFSHSAKGGNKHKKEKYIKKCFDSEIGSDNSWKNSTGSEREYESGSEKRSGIDIDKRRDEREISPLLQSYKQDAKLLEMKIKMAKDSELKRRLERNILDNKSNYEFRNSINDMNTEIIQARQKEWKMADALYQSHDVLLSMEQAAEKRCREQQEVIQDIVNEFKFKENQLAQANTDLEKLKMERERLMLETENLLKSADKGQEHLREELNKREDMLSSISDELESVKTMATKELKKKEGELEETKGRLETLESERNMLIKETAELSDKAGQHSSLLKRTLEVKERQLRKVNKEMEKLKTEQKNLVEESINLYQTANEGNNKLKELVKSKDNQLSEAYQELGQMKEIHEKLVWEANQLTKQADENNEKLKALFRSKEEQLTDAQLELERLKMEQNMLLESAKGLQDKVDCADEKVDELQSTVKQKEEQLAQKEKELESIRSFLSSTAEKETVARDKLEKFISELIDRADNAERELIVLKSRSNSDISGSPKHLPQPVPNTVESDLDLDLDLSCGSSIETEVGDSQNSPVRSQTKSLTPKSSDNGHTSSVQLPTAEMSTTSILQGQDSSTFLPQKINSPNIDYTNSEMLSQIGNIQKEEVQVLLHSGIDLHDVPNVLNSVNHEQNKYEEDIDQIPKFNRPTDDSSHIRRFSAVNSPENNVDGLLPVPRNKEIRKDESNVQFNKAQYNSKDLSSPLCRQKQDIVHVPKKPPRQNPDRVSIQPLQQNPDSIPIQPPPEFLDSDDVYAQMKPDSSVHAFNPIPQYQDILLERKLQKSENGDSHHEHSGVMSPIFVEELERAEINVSRELNMNAIPINQTGETLSHVSENTKPVSRTLYGSSNVLHYPAEMDISKPENSNFQQTMPMNNLHKDSIQNGRKYRRKPYENNKYGDHGIPKAVSGPLRREITANSHHEPLQQSDIPGNLNGYSVQSKSNLVQAGQNEGIDIGKQQISVPSDYMIENDESFENMNTPQRNNSQRPELGLGSTGNRPKPAEWQNNFNLQNTDRQDYDMKYNSGFNSSLPPLDSSSRKSASYFESHTKSMSDNSADPSFHMPHSLNKNWKNKGQTLYVPYRMETGKPVQEIPPVSFQKPTNVDGQLLSVHSKNEIYSHKPVNILLEDELQSRHGTGRINTDDFQEFAQSDHHAHSLSDLDDEDQDHSLNDVVSIPEYEQLFSEPEDNENSISDFHNFMDDNGIIWDMKYQNSDFGLQRVKYDDHDQIGSGRSSLSNSSSERDKKDLHVRFKNQNQNDVIKFNLKSRSAESLGTLSSDSYTPIQKRNHVIPISSNKGVFCQDLDVLTDYNTKYNSKSSSLESLKSVSSDLYVPLQRRDAKTQTFSENENPAYREKGNFNDSKFNLKSTSTGSLGSVSSDSYIPIQRRDAKTQTVIPELKVMADYSYDTKNLNLKSPSSESFGSFSSDSYIPFVKNDAASESESMVYKRGVLLSGRISPKLDNIPKTRNSSTQTWLLDRHIASPNMELIRERSPLAENRTILDQNSKHSEFSSENTGNDSYRLAYGDYSYTKRQNEKDRFREFTPASESNKPVLSSENDIRIGKKDQIKADVSNKYMSEPSLTASYMNGFYSNEKDDLSLGERKISNVTREKQFVPDTTMSNTHGDQMSKSEQFAIKHDIYSVEENSTNKRESLPTESSVFSHDNISMDSMSKNGGEMAFDSKNILSNKSVAGNTSELKTDNEMPVENKNIFSRKPNTEKSEFGNNNNKKDADDTMRKIEQEVMSEEIGPGMQHSYLSLERGFNTLDDSGINVSSSNDMSTDDMQMEHNHRRMPTRAALKKRSFSIDEENTRIQPEENRLDTEILSNEKDDKQNQQVSSVKTKLHEQTQLQTSIIPDEQKVLEDQTFGKNSVENSWFSDQKQSQNAMLADLTDTDDDYCQSLTSLDDIRERMSVASSLDSRLDTTIYKKREEIRKRRNALFQIFSFLDTKTLVDVALVCREWRKVSRQPALWKNVSLKYRKISAKFLMTISSWCTQTEHLVLEGLQPRDMYDGESREGYNSKISGALEPGLERLLQLSESTLKSIRIINCGKLLTDKSIWLVSCYSRVIKSICYISDTYPLGADVMWAVGSGCRDIKTLIIPPKYPCSSPEKFDNKCLQIISQCCHDLVKLSIGGSLIDINGLVLIAKSCQRLLELEFHYANDITEDVATAICRLGLNALQCLKFIHTPVDDKAILQCYKSCKHLKSIEIHLSASDYVDDLVNEDNVKIFKKYGDKLMKLRNKPGLGNILKLHLNDAS